MNENEVVGFANNDVIEQQALDVLAGISQRYVKVVHGAYEGDHPVAEQTVASVRATFAGPYNIPTDAVARINGNSVAEDYVLCPNESLEFAKVEGVKG